MLIYHTVLRKRRQRLAAGDELGYTQPAITQMMRSLEKEIGFPLLVKSRSGVEPTMEAQLLIPTMRLILSNEEKLDQEIGEIMGMHKGTIRKRLSSYH